jgi:hypothetical protein
MSTSGPTYRIVRCPPRLTCVLDAQSTGLNKLSQAPIGHDSPDRPYQNADFAAGGQEVCTEVCSITSVLVKWRGVVIIFVSKTLKANCIIRLAGPFETMSDIHRHNQDREWLQPGDILESASDRPSAFAVHETDIWSSALSEEMGRRPEQFASRPGRRADTATMMAGWPSYR